ncbi:MAG: site-specific DNA-methyltransferase [Chloroflexota bacterium]
MIYVDPPYGIKFGSNWQVSTRKRDVKDGKATDATRQPEQIRAFRDTWELGIHSYLSYLRDRFVVARDLLTESGSIFVQIGDENVHLVRSLLDEVFGSENHVATITVQKTGSTETGQLPRTVDFILFYGRDRDRLKYHQLYSERLGGTTSLDRYDWVEKQDGTERRLSADEIRGVAPLPAGRRFRFTSMLSARPAGSGDVREFVLGGRSYKPGTGTFKSDQEGLTRLAWSRRLRGGVRSLQYVRHVDDFPVIPVNDRWESVQIGTGLVYVVQTATKVIERCVLMATDPGDLVLDPTCGSGTTAYAAEQWGRRWITVDTSRVALALARTRLMSARYPYYLLADSPEGQRKESELSGDAPIGATERDIRKGFVYERVPHVTLKSIARNPDIHEGMSHEEIDAAIARHADTETLYDRPYSDKKVVRVAGPFTVESLSPHRVVADDPADHAEPVPAPIEESGRYVEMILDNLRSSGVDNRMKDERLRFESLDPFPGKWIQAEGTYVDGEHEKRAAVAIGPEFGTVSRDLVREAAIETGGYFDLLIVCGFAFDARADEERAAAERIGRLTVLSVRMNPDLAMGSDLLKKTRSGNLFTIFGEPDISIRGAEDDQLIVEIRGLDTYVPTTGEVRSESTDDIATWFIDTDYDARSFFVRHAYFCGDEPYERLRKALRAEIDESAWDSLYSTVSRPFPRPASGRIAVKVINHYGDEILSVHDV